MRPSSRRSIDAKQHIEGLSSEAIANIIRGNYSSVNRQRGANSSSGRLQSLSKMVGDGNRGCKEIMRRGGEAPSMFFDQARLEEMADLFSDEPGFYYHHFGVLAAGRLDSIFHLTHEVEILGYLALRSLLVKRTKLEALISSNKKIDAFDEEDLTLNDSLHLITTNGENLGWVMVDKDANELMKIKEITQKRGRDPEKWAQGVLRNAITLAEVNRRLIQGDLTVTSECTDPFSVAQLQKIGDQTPSGLTLISRKSMNFRDVPKFGSLPTLDFGRHDVRKPVDSKREVLVTRLQRELPQWLSAHRLQLSSIFKGEYGQGGNRLIAGGRKGLNFDHLCNIR